MGKPSNSCAFLLVMALCASLAPCGCGRKEIAPPTEGGENAPASRASSSEGLPLGQQTEQKLDPLTKEDIELYLKAMGMAADRVKNPTPADKAALESAKNILARSASGRVPTPDDVKTLERANLVALAMDQIVAEELKLDGRTYRGIVEAVESVVPNPALGTAPGKDSSLTPEHAPTALEQRLSEVNTANETFLTTYRPDIQKLMTVVRNPANLPK